MSQLRSVQQRVLLLGILVLLAAGWITWKSVLVPCQSRNALLRQLPGLPDLSNEIPQLADQIRQADAQARNDPSAETIGSLAMIYHANHMLDQACTCYQVAVSVAPDDFRWNYYLAVVEESLNNNA